MNFGALVREKRELQQMQVQELAQKASLCSTYISLIEHGRVVPGIANVVKISKALGLNIGELSRITQKTEPFGVAAEWMKRNEKRKRRNKTA